VMEQWKNPDIQHSITPTLHSPTPRVWFAWSSICHKPSPHMRNTRVS
jgi:hypothetical protein